MFPDDVESITMTRQDYDRQMENLIYKNIELKEKYENSLYVLNKNLDTTNKLIARIDKAIKYIEKYGEECGNGEQYFTTSTPITYLLDILKGSDKE